MRLEQAVFITERPRQATASGLVYLVILQGAPEQSPVLLENHKNKSFIALQLPSTRPITETVANQIFDVLEQGSESWLSTST